MRLAEVELVYAAYYYKTDLPGDFELAKGTALTFLEYFYDKIDLEDKSEVTASVINCYIYALGDTWGVYRLPSEFENYETDMSGSFVGIGVEIELNNISGEMKITHVIENSGAERAGLLAGDLIVAVDGADTASLGIDKTTAKIRGESGTTVVISVLRDTERLDITVTRGLVVEESVKYSIDEEKIAYIEVKRFKGNTAEQFAEALAKAKSDGARGIIFDLRGNPGGYLNAVLASLDLLVPSGTTLATYFDKTSGKVVLQSSSEDSLDIPVAVICNGNTASAGELFTAAVRDFKNSGLISAVTVGTKTYGKGVMQTSYTFPDGAALNFTFAYYNPPSDVNYDGEGVTPDIIVEAPEEQYNAAYSALLALIDN